ncbi:acylphosphatase [Methylohalobius crimeensis]|uniref:acylphosphatase n=1 Tax=Methylohalobius crimeensis TaxID=244365 RepID=UPI0003B3CD26|nr:acylphosphatase [Methylohalobius crimeensis]
MRKRLEIRISGRVQGVFYRAATVEVAERLGVTGWVRNLPDGRVEVMAEGEEAALQPLLDWCRQGPPAAKVTDVKSTEAPATGEFKDFSMRR